MTSGADEYPSNQETRSLEHLASEIGATARMEISYVPGSLFSHSVVSDKHHRDHEEPATRDALVGMEISYVPGSVFAHSVGSDEHHSDHEETANQDALEGEDDVVMGDDL